MLPQPSLRPGQPTAPQCIVIPFPVSHAVAAAATPHCVAYGMYGSTFVFIAPPDALAPLQLVQTEPATAQAPLFVVVEAVRMLSAAVGGPAALKKPFE